MKYTILGFNQSKIVEYGLNMNEVLLLDYIYDLQADPTVPHTIIDEICYTWVSHTKLLEDLPILNIGETMLKKLIKHLVDLELIHSNQVRNGIGRGTKAYYAISVKGAELKYGNDQVENIIPEQRPSIKNYPSDNKYIDKTIEDNKGNNNIPNGILLPATPDKKKNLYQKCIDAVTEYTENESIKMALIEYLELRLKMSDKPIYGVNQWKGLLKKLREICGDNAEKALTVIDESIARGWATFVNPTERYNKQSSQVNVRCDVPTEKDIQAKEAFIEQLKQEGKQWQF